MEALVYMDEKGRILIPKELRERSGYRVFKARVMGDGAIVLEPLGAAVRKLGGKYRGLLKADSMEELEEVEEEYLRREGRI
ncbi:MAG: AbrB/MazE/SpoVT family DNA-binding domain-containing protein [Thermoproteota archaeon]|nr:MAG: AbrB/MazE/SpoVT family DNA-binding domain-containing protein [Candidatus Korarchaeota archaeon]RLG55041.1 MAG: AbrB/MazE/SpoVT family DNA-binding domain-containing protein [Candidatus Korarchaeota archaeon]